uniref:Uncharacterized protein n=1 Tax=Chromera velia CCMP2878 TaxID=1169474 RepID=A0A0G4HNW6_9ALVE|eukprot:Cvel_29605.t1-p1 / transcript=Cvel_29605.t1 / gene=Cvel_29605 / organism=Chromera_velia_CCMP2878 / gene_product=hypothetical protein / transcript_product=hypothetical protein / location=Cvel_scaffold4079:10041-11616(+) / protein_length=86 / sequence_SO=supercontig / SO=protein_coding / is_pseudo=false
MISEEWESGSYGRALFSSSSPNEQRNETVRPCKAQGVIRTCLAEHLSVQSGIQGLSPEKIFLFLDLLPASVEEIKLGECSDLDTVG